MYIIELILKIKDDFKKGKFKKQKKELPEIEKCDHLFLPIDSTGKVLACSKCGAVVKTKNKQVNPFKSWEFFKIYKKSILRLIFLFNLHLLIDEIYY